MGSSGGRMGAIFLSYSRDDLASAETLARVLETAGHEIWWDRRIGSGEEFATEIEAALDRADIVLVAWSAHSARSAWVRDEAAAGRDDGRLLPVTIDTVTVPVVWAIVGAIVLVLVLSLIRRPYRRRRAY